MMTRARCWTGVVLSAGLAASASGQVPGVPAGAPAGAAAAAPAAGQAAGAAGKTHALKDFFAGCKEKFCASPLGSLVKNSMQPISALSGGILGGCCPTGPTAADLAKPPTSAEGAAARIKQDEAQAKARREAVKYLGTVDCHYWPEAEAGLINGLRADRNECVRLEAAWSLGRGCCCTKNIIEALSITVSGSNRDGNPAETSERVKAAAHFALDHCLARLGVAVAELGPAPAAEEKQRELPPKEKPAAEPVPAPGKDGTAAKTESVFPLYYQKIQAKPLKELIEESRKALEQSQAAPVVLAGARDRPNSISEIVTKAMGESLSPDKAPGYTPTPAPPLAAPPAPPRAVVATPPQPVKEQPVLVKPRAPEVVRPAAVEQTKPRAPEVGRPAVVEQPKPRAPAVVRPASVEQPKPRAPEVVRPAVVEQPAPARSKMGIFNRFTSEEKAEVATPAPTAAPRPLPQEVRDTKPRAAELVKPQTPPAAMPPARTIEAPKPPVRTENIRPAGLTPAPVLDKPAPMPINTTPAAHSSAVRPATLTVTQPERVTKPVVAAPALTAADPRLRQVLQTLQNSNYPEHREWAAGQLASSEMRSHTEVVPALVKSAREDKEAAIRVACVRALGKMNANSPAVVAALQTLKADADARVRGEVATVLAKFGHGPTGFAVHSESAGGSR